MYADLGTRTRLVPNQERVGLPLVCPPRAGYQTHEAVGLGGLTRTPAFAKALLALSGGFEGLVVGLRCFPYGAD